MSHHCSQSEMNGDLQSEEIENIDGLGLIKNPFELHKKGKKDK